jgi:uncharacterized glyoxalase superfamily protein PhnB
MTKARFKYTIMYVKDVAATVEFYEKAFALERDLLSPELDYAELSTGKTTLAFASFELGNSNFKDGFTESDLRYQPFGIELGFVTDDIQATWEQAVAAGAKVLEPIVKKPWGQEVGYLRDINGFLIEICTAALH